jgi:hypothetical protein
MPLSGEAAAINADIVAAILTMRATIYTRASAGGFTTTATSGLACLLESVSANAAASVPDRAALAAMRVLRFDATYDLPAGAYQVEVDAFPGKRWAPQANTDDVDYPPGIGVLSKTVIVMRTN